MKSITHGLIKGFAEIPLSEVAAGDTFRLRYRLDTGEIVSSIRRSGFIMPVVVAEWKDRLRVVSGHRRVEALREMKAAAVPVLVLDDVALGETDLFLIALHSNTPSSYDELDRVVIVKKALADFGFPEEDLVAAAPAFGLPPSLKVIREYQALSALDGTVLDEAAKGGIPFKALRELNSLKPEESRFLGEWLASFAFTAAEASEAVVWLKDLSRKKRVPLREIAEAPELAALAKKENRKAAAEAAHAYLRAHRFPSVVKTAAEFKQNAAKAEKDGIKIEAPPFFEDDHLTVSLKAGSYDKLEALIAHLKRHEDHLKKLFDLVK